MGQRLKEFYFPEDYGVEVNVGNNMKLKIGECLLMIQGIKSRVSPDVLPSIQSLECMIEKLYSIKEDPKNNLVHGAYNT